MNWSDERYVRLYTRDTVGWVALPWEARCVLVLLLRKVDRAGVLDIGDHGNEGLAGLLQMPIEVVERGMAKLIARGTVVLNEADGTLVMPNFMDAQEAKQSDRVRQKESRERRRVGSTVTLRDTPSRNVTERHEESHAVTDGHSVLSRAVPCRAEKEECPPSGVTPPVRPKPEASPEAHEIAAYLATAILSHQPTAKLRPAGWAAEIDRAMRIDGRTPEQLRRVIDHAHRSPRVFWRANLRSGDKLREHYDRLESEMAGARASPLRIVSGSTGIDTSGLPDLSEYE